MSDESQQVAKEKLTSVKSEKLAKLLSVVKDKDVFLASHWDCDGVTSGALIYHLIKDHAKSVETISKGDIFIVSPEDVKGKPDVIICADIRPSADLISMEHEPLVIPIDHHPNEEINLYPFSVYDNKSQSCSLLIWKELMPETENPYFLFLTLLGYFGDGGQKEDIPDELWLKAMEFIPEMLKERPSLYNNGMYLEVEKYVSSMNVGKRMFWSGELPLEMLKDLTHYRSFIRNEHPIALEIMNIKHKLRSLYSMNLNVNELSSIAYAVIESDKNIQGVLCARYMKDKPILVMNRINSRVIGSLRSPTHLDFDAGEYLSRFNDKLESYQGGGHREAAGFTVDEPEFESFLELLKKENA